MFRNLIIRFSFLSIKRLEDFKNFRARLNKFFMEFVSELVFSEHKIPSDEIVRWLMQCVTFKEERTRDFSVFHTDEVIDPTPVLRSFLLKLFLQNPSLDDHLDDLVQSWTEEDGIFKVQKMAMLVDCYQVSTGDKRCETTII